MWRDMLQIQRVCEDSDLIYTILKSVKAMIYDNMKISELCNLLYELYDIVRSECCEIISIIKTEIGIYSKDGKHLKLVY